MPRRGLPPSAVPGGTFPLPDWLAAPSSRPVLSLAEFARSVVSSSPIHAQPSNAANAAPLPEEVPSSQSEQETPDVLLQRNPLESEDEQASLPVAARIAALQRVPIGADVVEQLPPCTPPTFAEILDGLKASSNGAAVDILEDCDSDDEIGDRVFVEVAVYDAEAPTMSVQLRLSVLSPLTDLIDAVPCSAVVVNDDSIRNMRTTNMLYINHVLYVDHRFGSTDYATPVLRFLRQRDVPARTILLDEERTRLLDITMQLGVPYVFVHRGDCEHLLIFSDLYKEYGEERGEGRETKVLWQRYPRVIPCDVCGVRHAEKFTIRDSFSEACPSHYCATCYKLAHYSQTGELFDSSRDLLVYSHPPPM